LKAAITVADIIAIECNRIGSSPVAATDLRGDWAVERRVRASLSWRGVTFRPSRSSVATTLLQCDRAAFAAGGRRGRFTPRPRRVRCATWPAVCRPSVWMRG